MLHIGLVGTGDQAISVVGVHWLWVVKPFQWLVYTGYGWSNHFSGWCTLAMGGQTISVVGVHWLLLTDRWKWFCYLVCLLIALRGARSNPEVALLPLERLLALKIS